MFICIISTAQQPFINSNVFKINFLSIDDQKIAINNLNGKRILIVTFDASNPDSSQLISLDSLYHQQSDLIVIAIPANDFGNTPNIDSLKNNLVNELKLGLSFSGIGKCKNGEGQHPLMKWICQNSSNNHFNIDIQHPGDMFLIGVNGTLVSVLDRSVKPTGEIMKYILTH